ncbi:unnamed protein product [Pseudo-nitzschia multistriata]|uniref:Uncharacterized protein n=1 Tax=Pseudo-nitzschia multistriata TaxID=183589 RepID=A0A448YUB2_9STRA|nr:unnamed protein product [Pseudo-nitzschia multistriata]
MDLGPELSVDDVALVHSGDLRHDDDALVSFCGGHHGQPDPRVSAGGFDDGGLARRDLSAGLGLLDHGEGNTVLDGAARILHLELEQDLVGHHVLREHAVDLYHRCLPDEITHVFGVSGESPPCCRTDDALHPLEEQAARWICSSQEAGGSLKIHLLFIY